VSRKLNRSEMCKSKMARERVASSAAQGDPVRAFEKELKEGRGLDCTFGRRQLPRRARVDDERVE
jgi:hypothetical protein